VKPSARGPSTVLGAWLALVSGAAARQEPSAAPGSTALETALRSHPCFGKLQLERVEGRAPYLFLFQQVTGASPQRAQAFVDEMAPFLDGTRAVFEQEIARPNGLTLRPGFERFPMIVLASQADLEQAQRSTHAWWHLGGPALHERELNACVLYDELKGTKRPKLERVRAARHVFVHACQAAWYAGPGKAPLEGWILEGMADGLANTGADPAALRVDPVSLRQFAADTLDEQRRFANLRTIEELFQVGDASRLDAFYRERWPKGLERLKTTDGWAFLCQAGLVFGYLWSDENARHRPALVAFLGDALRGLGTLSQFSARFQPSTAAELEQGFLAWAVREHDRAFPLEKLDAEKTLRALARGEAAGYPPPRPALDLADASAEERLAKAIHDFATGAEDAAGRALDALLEEELEKDLHERVERERRRWHAWRELRDAHLADLAKSAGVLSFTVAGKSFQARVLALEDGAVVVEPNRSGKDRLAPGDLDALALAQEIHPQGKNEWARLVPYALREDPRTRKLLKDAEGEAGGLLADARDDYPGRLRLGRMLARIQALGRAPVPATRGEAEAQLAEVRALRTEGADIAAVQRKDPALLERARALLEAEVALLDTPELFGGTLEPLEGERVRLIYDFDDPRELDDFEACTYPVLATQRLPGIEVPDQPFHLENGRLVALGQAALRSRFELGAPLSVRYRLAYAEAPDAEPILYFYLGIADDRAEHFVTAINFCTLLVRDGQKSDQKTGKQFPIHIGALYTLEMFHDGQKVSLRCEGQEVSVPAGGRRDGALFLRAHSVNPVQLPELVLEGRLSPASVAAMRKARVEQELATF